MIDTEKDTALKRSVNDLHPDQNNKLVIITANLIDIQSK